ncbi:MAG: TIGR03905 family TSCPD domain-containing protein [Candidatus Gastranaerophilaceae bacterium]
MDSNIDIIKFMTQGTCSKMINVAIKDGKIMEVEFIGGCNGNLKGIASLVAGQSIDEVVEKLQGITCGPKPTSCPDQLAQCLIEYKSKKLVTK